MYERQRERKKEREIQTQTLNGPSLGLPVRVLTDCLVAKSCPILLPRYGLSFTRFLCSWHSPGKNSGVGCHFLVHITAMGEQSGNMLHSFKYAYLGT